MKFDQARLITFTVSSIFASAICVWWVPVGTWLCLTLALTGLTVILSRLVDSGSILTMPIAGSFAIRALLTVCLFATSYFQLPFFASLQLGAGFWLFGGDAVGYHDHAVKLLNAWYQGIDLPSVYIEGDLHYDLYKGLSLPVAIIYRFLGSIPLHFLLLNAFVGAITGLLAYSLTLKIGDRRSALIAAGLVAFWPSSIIWSTQLLKDMSVIALVMLSLILIVSLWQQNSVAITQRDRNRFSQVNRWAILTAAIFGVTYFRNYLGALFVVTVLAVMSVAGLRSIWQRNWRETFLALGLVACVFGATAAGTSVDLLQLLSPRDPEVGHVRLGQKFEQENDHAKAAASYRRAIELNHEYASAYRHLGFALIEKGEVNAAIQSFETYLFLEKDPELKRSLRSVLSAKNIALSEVPSFSEEPRLSVNLGTEESKGVVEGIFKNIGVQSGRSWPGRLSDLRQAIAATGGTSVVDGKRVFKDVLDVAAFAPRAVLIAFLAPFPWDLLTEGSGGGLKPLSVPETMLIIFLLPALALAYWHRARRFRPDEWVLLVFVAVSAVAHGLVMANAGTLFRLRLQFFMPAIVLAATTLPSVIAGVFSLFGRSNSNVLRR